MSDTIDCAVIGSGVVGLAIARAFALAGREVIVLESANAIGTGTSSRNSEVIHAGIYYPKGSLKAQLCVKGKWMLYDYCADHGVNVNRCQKLIVATQPEQVDTLKELAVKATDNGVDDLQWLDADQVHEREPAITAAAALLSPSTGVIDTHGLMLAYQGDLETAGGVIAFNSPVIGGAVEEDGIRLSIGGDEPMEISCRTVINSAGHGAQAIAAALKGFPSTHVAEHHMCKGSYFMLTGKNPFTHLIYPVPEKAGLGTHLTLDLAGRARFGPDIEWVEEIDYAVDPNRADFFYKSVRQFWPDLPDGALAPGYSGIRPKVQRPGGHGEDFVIQGAETHGIKGLVNLFGIESPGLTASLAIADTVLELV